jgi:hypothetical protein
MAFASRLPQIFVDAVKSMKVGGESRLRSANGFHIAAAGGATNRR